MIILSHNNEFVIINDVPIRKRDIVIRYADIDRIQFSNVNTEERLLYSERYFDISIDGVFYDKKDELAIALADLFVFNPAGSLVWGSITGTLSSQTDLQTALNAKQATLTETNFGAFTNGLTAKTTLVDADSTDLVDSADSNKAKKVTWLNVWNYIKSKADGIYLSKDNGTTYDTNFIKTVTQAEYDAIGTPDATTLYFIV